MNRKKEGANVSTPDSRPGLGPDERLHEPLSPRDKPEILPEPQPEITPRQSPSKPRRRKLNRMRPWKI